MENDDLRQRLSYMETLCGRDSAFIRDQVSNETSNVDWARVLLDENTDDMIITVSREKIAHELIRLRTEVSKLKQSGNSGNEYGMSSQRNNKLNSTTTTSNSLSSRKNSSLYSSTHQKFGLVGHKQSVTPMRQRPSGGKLIPMPPSSSSSLNNSSYSTIEPSTKKKQ